MVKFSVVVTVQNSEKFLDECLKSVINQTLDDIEVICVDCNSKDNSLNILNKYENNDNRLKVIDNESDLGVAKNRCIELAQGEFITFVDGTDKLSANALKSVYDYFKKDDSIDVVAIPIFYFEFKMPFEKSLWYTNIFLFS